MTVFEQEIDPVQDPTLANEVVRQLTDAKVPPAIAPPPANVVSLPGGYIDAYGSIHREARIREVNGSDEETLAREMRNPNFTIAREVDLILRRTVEAVGTIEPVTPDVLGDMLIGDRSALMLAVRILTFGSDWEVAEFPCRLCGATFGVVIELEKDILMKQLADPLRQEVDVPLRHGRVATVKLLTGAVQLEALADRDRTLPEQQSAVIDRCVRQIDNRPVAGPIAQQMGIADRQAIIKAMDEAQPGPLMEEVVVGCTECGQEAKYAISLLDLFR